MLVLYKQYANKEQQYSVVYNVADKLHEGTGTLKTSLGIQIFRERIMH